MLQMEGFEISSDLLLDQQGMESQTVFQTLLRMQSTQSLSTSVGTQQMQLINGQVANGQVPYGLPLNGQALNGQMANGQLPYGLPLNDQVANGQVPHVLPLNGQVANGQVPHVLPLNVQVANGQVANGQPRLQMPQMVPNHPHQSLPYLQTAQQGEPYNYLQLSIEATSDLNPQHQQQQQEQQRQLLPPAPHTCRSQAQTNQLLPSQAIQPPQYLPQAPPQQVQPHQQTNPDGADMDDLMSIIGSVSADVLHDTYMYIDPILDKLQDGANGQDAEDMPVPNPIQAPNNKTITVGPTPPMTQALLVEGNSNAIATAVKAAGDSRFNQAACIPHGGVSMATVDNTANQVAQPADHVAQMGLTDVPVVVSAASPSNSTHQVPSAVAKGTTVTIVDNPVGSPTCSSTSSSKDVPESSSAQATKPKTAKQKRKTKAKSKRAANQMSSLETKEKKPKTDDAEVTNISDDELTNKRQLNVQLFYQFRSLSKGKQGTKVNSRDGCLVFHKKPYHFQDASLDIADIEFPMFESPQDNEPDGDNKSCQSKGHRTCKLHFPGLNIEPMEITKKQMDTTKDLLDALSKGIHISCDNDGNIFARRFCRSHVYCYSTVPGEGFERVSVQNNSSNEGNRERYVKKLTQDEFVKVFDGNKFQKILTYFSCSSQMKLSPCPVVYFTFGQPWEPKKPLSNCLIYLKVTQKSAREMRRDLKGGEDDSFNCNEVDLEESMSTLCLSSGQDGPSGQAAQPKPNEK
ncbi:uncharacterized protein LOC110980133 isoform X2 [Acanthaster planci]|uniref:Uncharacterized protein LOC110980133 isoform X2 n=1 Tax=Acanthaster planci TaxID=133434 RepID=A0A8B7YHV6_ACAPL|nr:uncharacterized protein LOC110980133 isoform X2 [Acanthaster planci]